VPNVEVVQAFAPDGLENLPNPTAVFIGGSGGRMEEIIDFVCQRLKPGGRIVINIVVLEHLSVAIDALKARGFVPEVTLVNIARSTSVGELTRFEALNPVFVVTAVLERMK
jgi:precorrin-6Y C5,15-methyltransferase (decarboxylating)